MRRIEAGKNTKQRNRVEFFQFDRRLHKPLKSYVPRPATIKGPACLQRETKETNDLAQTARSQVQNTLQQCKLNVIINFKGQRSPVNKVKQKLMH